MLLVVRLNNDVHDDAVHTWTEKLEMKLLRRVFGFCFAGGCALG